MKKLIFLPILLLATGCVHEANVLRYSDTVYEPKPDNFTIEILDRDNVGKKFEVIAMITDKQNSIKSQDEVINALKQEARNLGGDALIDLKTNTYDKSHDWIPSYETQYSALVIRYLGYSSTHFKRLMDQYPEYLNFTDKEITIEQLERFEEFYKTKTGVKL